MCPRFDHARKIKGRAKSAGEKGGGGLLGSRKYPENEASFFSHHELFRPCEDFYAWIKNYNSRSESR